MISSPYELSIMAAVSIMVFISAYMVFGPLNYNDLRPRYILSRRLMSLAIFILAIAYSIQLFVNPRAHGQENWSICLNFCTYFIEVPLFYAALNLILDQDYMRRFKLYWPLHVAGWLVYIALAVFFMKTYPDNQRLVLKIMAAIYCLYMVPAGIYLVRGFRKMEKAIDETQSDNLEYSTKWMSVTARLAALFGVSCAIFTFIPNDYLFIWILSSILFYVFIFCSYEWYMNYNGKVQDALEEKGNNEEPLEAEVISNYYRERDMATTDRLKQWIEERGFTEKGITIDTLASLLCTNRTYLSGYLLRSKSGHFREWINGLRIDYAKQLMKEDRVLSMTEIADRAGYSSLSHFTTTFTRSEGISPVKWKASQWK